MFVINKILRKRHIEDRGYLTPCWEFIGSQTKTGSKGYGQIGYKGKKELVHRLYFRLNVQNFNENLMVLHKCNNRICFNLEHLYQGDGSQNMYDRVAAGHDPNSIKIKCKHGHLLSGDNLYTHSGRRYCRTCRRLAQRVKLGK